MGPSSQEDKTSGVDSGQRAIFSGHQEPFDNFPFTDMALHDFGDIGLGPDPVPDALGIDHHARAIFTMIQTPGFIRSNDPLQPHAFNLFLKKGMQLNGTRISATTSGISLRTLINTDEDMMFERTHVFDEEMLNRPET